MAENENSEVLSAKAPTVGDIAVGPLIDGGEDEAEKKKAELANIVKEAYARLIDLLDAVRQQGVHPEVLTTCSAAINSAGHECANLVKVILEN